MPRLSTICAPRLLACGAALLAAGPPAAGIRDVGGRTFDPFRLGTRASVLFFVASDCPISNAYAPEIQRLCETYAPKGVACSLLYEDLRIDAAGVRAHLDEYRFRGLRAGIDAARTVARRARASVTPQAVIADAGGEIRYRGRIDDFYAAVGRPRRQVTVHDVRDAIDALLAGRPVPNPDTEAIGCAIVPQSRRLR